jgi:uncharacterized protein YndB with AHSA1/START domain
MVRHDSRSQPETLERPAKSAARKVTAPELSAPALSEVAPFEPALSEVGRQVSHGRTTVVFTRDLPSGTNSVWALLTKPKRLRLWAPYTSDRDLSQVGRCVLTMLGDGDAPDVDIQSVVLVADAPESLEYSWANDMLAWHVASIGSGSRLTLHQTLADESMASAVAAGWHLCLDIASAVLTGSTVAPIRGMDAMKHGWQDLNERYAVALGVPPTKIG